jgi:hypothetical protein
MPLQVVGDDADGGEGDVVALHLHHIGAARLLAVHADAGSRQDALATQRADVAQRFLQAADAVVHRMVVGQREQVEALADQMPQALPGACGN